MDSQFNTYLLDEALIERKEALERERQATLEQVKQWLAANGSRYKCSNECGSSDRRWVFKSGQYNWCKASQGFSSAAIDLRIAATVSKSPGLCKSSR